MKTLLRTRVGISIAMTTFTMFLIALMYIWVASDAWQGLICLLPAASLFVFPITYFLLSTTVKFQSLSDLRDPAREYNSVKNGSEEEIIKQRLQTARKKKLLSIIVSLGVLFILTLISYSGIRSFFMFWWKTSFKYALGGVFGTGLFYLIWSLRINQNYEQFKYSNRENNPLNMEADRNLSLATCPKCEETGYYFTPEPGADSSALICWKCRHTFSTVWCGKCGMGGDFVDMTMRESMDWRCPECNSNYTLPIGFYENPVTLKSWENLENNVQTSFTERQRQFRHTQARGSSWIFASLIISFTLVQPIVNSFYKTLSKLNIKLLPGEAAYGLLDCVSYLIFFVITWYTLLLFPYIAGKEFNRLRDRLNEDKTNFTYIA
jgi:hypothetical protein